MLLTYITNLYINMQYVTNLFNFKYPKDLFHAHSISNIPILKKDLVHSFSNFSPTCASLVF